MLSISSRLKIQFNNTDTKRTFSIQEDRGEAARIRKYKGRVFALQDEPEVARVWLPNSDSPSLAMTRAFGDFCLKDFSLISVPDVYYHCITDRDEFVVLATKGIFIPPNIISLQKENPTSSLGLRCHF